MNRDRHLRHQSSLRLHGDKRPRKASLACERRRYSGSKRAAHVRAAIAPSNPTTITARITRRKWGTSRQLTSPSPFAGCVVFQSACRSKNSARVPECVGDAIGSDVFRLHHLEGETEKTWIDGPSEARIDREFIVRTCEAQEMR